MSTSLDDSLDIGSPNEELAHTFRQRRLTYSKHHLQGAAAAALLAQEGLSDVDDEDTTDEKAAAGEKRTLASNQEDEPPSKRSKSQEEPTSLPKPGDSLQTRILHAGEIIKKAVSNPQYHSSHHRLGPKSKWRQRFSFCSTAPDTALPFPRSVVGTYSCHGMEPVYDSDYEHSEESSDEDKTSESALHGKNQSTQQSVAKINQDRGGVAYPYANDRQCALFGVYDGHGEGGELVSQYALGEVQRLLEERLLGLPRLNNGSKLGSINEDGIGDNENGHCASYTSSQEENIIKQAFQETFVKVDRGLLKESDIEPIYSGTTACVALLRHNKLYISNAGDSRAVLARRSTTKSYDENASAENDSTTLVTLHLSIDQNPDSLGEKERILTAGGFVSPPPEPGLSARVWLDAENTQIGLAMARSIGDHAVKGVGVTAEPVVTVHEVQKEDEFIILATDGVWEFIESEDAVKIVSKYLDCKNEGNGNDKNCASKACEALIKAAMAKWHEYEGDYRDDVTAIVVRLKDIWKYH